MKRQNIRLLSFLLLFLLCLMGLRFIWMGIFQENYQPDIQNGVIDLREWRWEEQETLLLNGEWKFYPSQFMMDETLSEPVTEMVPGGWKDTLGSPFGYGSYRLQIKVDPQQDEPYALYIREVRTSAEIYVNGQKEAEVGRPAKTEAAYQADLMPRMIVLTPDETGNLDIVIQAANFKDSRNGGINFSVRLGTESAITNDVQLSNYLQVCIAAVLFIFLLFSLIIYAIGDREKKILYFALLSFSLFTGFLFYSGGKVFQQFVNISYDLEYWLIHTVYLIIFYALVQSTDHQKLPYWPKLFPFWKWGMIILAMVSYFLPMSLVFTIRPIYNIFAFITVIIVIASVMQMLRNNKAVTLVLCSFIAISHHGIWNYLRDGQGMRLTFYPFDLVIALICFSLVLVQRYFNVYKETNELANRLKQINREKDQFLANTSHEFRNPLNSILLLSQSVKEREEANLSNRSIHELDTVLNVGRQMNLLLTDLLEARRLEDSKPNLHKQAIILEPIATMVLDVLNASSSVKKLETINQIPKNFPAVYADENRVRQIIYNLVDNAVKYTNHGQIILSALVKDSFAEIYVSDTGIGISPDKQKQLFLPYEQGQSSAPISEGGFGLGLSITKQLVELHGGTIRVSANEEQGTTFAFTLALADPETAVSLPQDGIRSTSQAEESEPLFPNRKELAPTVLIVDDNPASLLAIEASLPAEVYETVLVSDAHQALEELKKRKCDIVISDIMMPEISGYQLTEMIRQRYSLTELPVLLLTGGNTDLPSAFMAGANDFVTKPVDPIELKARMDSLISLKHVAEQQLQLETAWLQAQIQPHFIFNTLNAIMAFSEWNIEEMKKLLNEFSHFLRSKFQFQQMESLIPLEEELNIVRSYLYIEQVRFQDALHVKWDLDSCQQVQVPFLTVQPLVENAVKHGIRDKQGEGTVTIKVKKIPQKSKLRITIEDDGTGMESTEISMSNRNGESGVGIANVEKRLRRFLDQGLTIESSPGKGTSISFEIDIDD
ncbi:hybrid sensor histidine kinase/response regulator [Gracilibacillus timonensis]|uniref:hybrid sensor histidine kinase/response regulator n=1 Tax=Gracilibacillus timonensis TaxID=1816696 RepID=UPI0008265F12|nr:ATP-binding protein [Gracilibacillus timonensis]